MKWEEEESFLENLEERVGGQDLNILYEIAMEYKNYWNFAKRFAGGNGITRSGSSVDGFFWPTCQFQNHDIETSY